MSYIIRNEGTFGTLDNRCETQVWASTNQYGDRLEYPTRKAAQQALDSTPQQYDGISNHNVLAHNQHSGSTPVIVRYTGQRWARY